MATEIPELGISIGQRGKNYRVRARGRSVGWERRLGKLVADGVLLDGTAAKQLLAKRGDVVVYSVLSLGEFAPRIKEISEKWGINCDVTVLRYGVFSPTAEGELFCTYGHRHETRCAEIYTVLAGNALLALFDEKAALQRVVLMRKGDEHLIEPQWLHRLYCGADSGAVVLGFVPKKAGHDYGAVQGKGLPYHPFKADILRYERNPRYGGVALRVERGCKRIGATELFFKNPEKLKAMLELG
jgi:oxalate decarboxylase/phosphoglucose isomerase-like protein (cupin superfamily)